MRKIVRFSIVATLTVGLTLTAACGDRQQALPPNSNAQSYDPHSQGGTSDQGTQGQSGSLSGQDQSGQVGLNGSNLNGSNRNGSNQNGVSGSSAGAGGGPRIQSVPGDAASGEETLAFTSLNGTPYIPLREIARVLEYNLDWAEDTSTAQIGDNDPAYTFTANSNEATKEGETIRMGQPAVVSEGSLYIPVSAIGDLFQEDMTYTLTDGQLVVHPTAETITKADINGPEDAAGDDPLAFADDPDDPFKGEEPADTAEETQRLMKELDALEAAVRLGELDQEEAVPTARLKNVNLNGIISTGRRYLGVKYRFGAAPYPKSGRFDCSTFTDYVYSKHGVNLPRTARAQSRNGNSVSRKSLRKGDLMFFYVPGRFKSNRTVGHVGIYMGNNRMIHASPEPKNGVQITNINKAYWKKTFLRAKRIAY